MLFLHFISHGLIDVMFDHKMETLNQQTAKVITKEKPQDNPNIAKTDAVFHLQLLLSPLVSVKAFRLAQGSVAAPLTATLTE